MELIGSTGHPLVYSGVFLAVCSLLVYATYKHKRRSVEAEFLERVVQPACRSLGRNLQMLRQGDVGWRRLARGKGAFGLSLVAPVEKSSRRGCYVRFRRRFPAVAASMERIDVMASAVGTAAEGLARKLESPLRQGLQQEGKGIAQESAQRLQTLCRHRQDTWMLQLSDLINGHYVNGSGGQYGESSAQTATRQLTILRVEGGDEFREFENLKRELHRESRSLQESLGRIALTMRRSSVRKIK